MVIEFEESGSFARKPQKDPVGNWEIGYGSIWDWRNVPKTRVTEKTPEVDEETARWFLSQELQGCLIAIANNVKVPVSLNEKAALEDFIYNVGIGNFQRSTLLRRLNAGDHEGAAQELLNWDMAGGKHLAGLLRRRKAELDLMRTPDDLP